MEGVSQTTDRTRAFQALRHRDFRLLFSGQAVSLVGDAAFLTALGWKTFTIAGAGKIGLVLSVQGAGLLTTHPAVDMVSFTGSTAVGKQILAQAAPTVKRVALELGGKSAQIYLPDAVERAASGPLVVEPSHLPSANSLMGVARWGGFVVGPALAGSLYHGAGSAWVFAIDALSFLVSAALMLLARPRAVEVEPSVGTVREILDGARYVSRIPWLWVTITLFAVILMLQLAPQQVLLPKLVKDHFERGVGAYAALSAMVGVGTVCGTLLFGHYQPRRRRGVLSYWLWLINSLAIAGMALSPWYPLAGALALARGCCIGFGVAVWETMLQEMVPARLLGRVVSLDFFGSFGLMPVGLALWGAIAGIAPPGPMIAAGALVSAGMITVVLTRPWLRAVE